MYSIESSDEDFGKDGVIEAVRAASIALSAKKKVKKAAKEAQDVAHKELKCKGKGIEERKAEVRKKTMRSIH